MEAENRNFAAQIAREATIDMAEQKNSDIKRVPKAEQLWVQEFLNAPQWRTFGLLLFPKQLPLRHTAKAARLYSSWS